MNRTDISHPSSFKDGVRVLLLMLRAKDGGSAKTDRKATKKIITRSPAEFDEALEELRSLWQPDQRIYATINARSIEKAIRIFKYRQLDAEWFDEVDRHNFYLDLENRWISCLKDKSASVGSLFLFDIDNDLLDHEQIFDDLKMLRLDTEALGASAYWYRTRNGWHFISKPFNPKLAPLAAQPLLMKNALMLWSY